MSRISGRPVQVNIEAYAFVFISKSSFSYCNNYLENCFCKVHSFVLNRSQAKTEELVSASSAVANHHYYNFLLIGKKADVSL